MGRLGARRVAAPIIALGHQAADAAASQFDGRGKAGRSGARDEDGNASRGHLLSPLSLLKTPKAKKSWSFSSIQSFE